MHVAFALRFAICQETLGLADYEYVFSNKSTFCSVVFLQYITTA